MHACMCTYCTRVHAHARHATQVSACINGKEIKVEKEIEMEKETGMEKKFLKEIDMEMC
jgi:hypothetical protein